ncbi:MULTISPECIES: hypothetical protein [unclassified Streptomyces]|uniref:hypothetical protein n=1 Tax=unclassified Streptomyces TaxID=2593676 RepID=UPI00073BAAB1|nr:hypothetical protein APS67_002712 [Streptomyces sp. AVP053U2]
MRWLLLYARSRRVPASATVIALTALTAWIFLDEDGKEPVDPRVPALLLCMEMAAASVGLGGPDAALERTAAIRWAPRRAVHVLLIGTAVGVVLSAVHAWGGRSSPPPASSSGTARA